MKIVKLTKTLMNSTPSDLLIKIGAVDLDKMIAYPQHVYFSKEDYKKFENNVKAKYKKEYEYLNAKQLAGAVGMEMLNLGPNSNMGDALKPGFAVVDTDAIEKEKTE